MPSSPPQTSQEFMQLPWSDVQPFYQELADRPLSASNAAGWLADWSALTKLWYETYQRLYVGITVDTTDQEAERRYDAFMSGVYSAAQIAEQRLKQKFLASGLEPEGFEVPLRILRLEAGLFRPENVPLLAEELKLANDYERVVGAQTVEWGGRETTLPELQPVFQDPERSRRETAWRLAARRQLADRDAINAKWVESMDVRRRLAANAGLPDYRAYRWRKLLRLDYTPADCLRFHAAIEQVVVPAARQRCELRRKRLGVDRLRPWDLDVDPWGRPPLRPYQTIRELEEKTAAVFKRVDPQFGAYFETMRREGLLDLENRKGKAPGGYCTDFPVARRPFILANSVGVHDDVQTMLHEGGHAFHVFETSSLPYFQHQQVPFEFAEVASMGMELLASPYLTADEGGFYTPADAARIQADTLERWLLFWPYMAVVDAFQHWAYQNHSAASDLVASDSVASDPVGCDAKWSELWDRFMVGVDWSGLEQEKATGWQRKAHIHTDPFYYVEYGLALLGALQVWRSSLQDYPAAVAAYRRALSLGYTVPLPQLYAAAGAEFTFDASILGDLIGLMLRTIDDLERQSL